MELLPETLLILARIQVQTLVLSALFVLAGRLLVRVLLPEEPDRPWSLSFRYGAGFFLGLSAFLVVWVALARVTPSARIAMWFGLAFLVCTGSIGWRKGSGPHSAWYHHLGLTTSLLILVMGFTISTATLWLEAHPTTASPEPDQLTSFGSLHSGRYAKYSIYIAEHNRIPFAPQNMGHALLAAAHLLLGSEAPLAALMAWTPCVLAGLACLVFGVLRSWGLSFSWALGGTFFVLLCNIALSLVSTLVVDSGSPLAFAGYADVTLAAATLLLGAVAVRGALTTPGPRPRGTLLLPGLLGMVWCWYGPQNIVVGLVAVSATGLLWLRTHPETRRQIVARLGSGLAVFCLAVVAGGLQLGTFLPQAMREDIGSDLSPAEGKVRIRPYVQFVTTNWTERRAEMLPQGSEWLRPCVYESEYWAAKDQGSGAVIASMLRLFEAHLVASVRIYGFLLLGLALMAWRLRQTADEGLRAWFWLGLGAFLTGYAIVFGLELGSRSNLGNFGYIKWWLTRFLVPACVLCLTGLVLALSPLSGTTLSRGRRMIWALLLIGGCFGPTFEFAGAFAKNWMERAAHDPLAHRLNLLAHVRGSAWTGNPFARAGR